MLKICAALGEMICKPFTSGCTVKVIELLRDSTRNGTPAMKARSRKLLIQLAGR